MGIWLALTHTPHGYVDERIEHMNTTEYQVTGMSCGHCEASVRSEVGQIPGVTDIQVSAQTGRLVIAADRPIEDAAVIAAVDEAGYAAARA
jgi:copper chaperone